MSPQANRDDGGLDLQPLPETSFGAVARYPDATDTAAVVAAAETTPDALIQAFYDRQGLLVMPGLRGINEDPSLLVRLSSLFGPEVENYRQTLTAQNNIHAEVQEILTISNIPPADTMPPKRPDPPLTDAGHLPVQFPHRRGWHTDQSFRRPPPDISLFYAVIPAPKGQGQTLFADGIGVYEALDPAMKARLVGLEGLHVNPGTGRSEYAVRAGEAPKPLKAHEQPQRQPVLRRHPVTGKLALYLCEAGQMDWIEGPLVGLEPGPDGEGAALLYELMNHFTQPAFTYAHHWEQGDLVIYDNRSLIHSATWFDAEMHQRLMWRTTVWGNPGPEYDGEKRSWIPESGGD